MSREDRVHGVSDTISCLAQVLMHKEPPQLFRRGQVQDNSGVSGSAEGDLTNRALYKMYEMTGSCRRRPRTSKPLMSSVTEPPLHSWVGDTKSSITQHCKL